MTVTASEYRLYIYISFLVKKKVEGWRSAVLGVVTPGPLMLQTMDTHTPVLAAGLRNPSQAKPLAPKFLSRCQSMVLLSGLWKGSFAVWAPPCTQPG